MILYKLKSRFPTAEVDRLEVLADIWDSELDRIIRRMLQISEGSCAAIPLAEKHEAVFEMAKLVNFIEDKILDKKLSDSRIEEIDLNKERSWLESDQCADRIENTAQIFAEHVWIKFLNEWWRKHPVASSNAPRRVRRKFAKVVNGGVRRQHFSPKFSNKYWANELNEVRIYSRALDGSVKVEDLPAIQWGREDYIYTQSLESLFAAIESDAGVPYKKLLNMVPFSENDRRHWVAFLIAQMFRTPSFILRNLLNLKQIIERGGIGYPTDTASLRTVYETLFTNNQVFDFFYRLLCGHEWSILSVTPDECGFVRGDVPAIVDGSIENRTWKLIYPMTPSKCFIAGPETCEIPDVPIPKTRTLNDTQLRAVNKLIARRCRKSAIGVTCRNDSDLFEDSFGNETEFRKAMQPTEKEYWGRP